MDDRLLEAAITWSVESGTPLTDTEALAAFVARWTERGITGERWTLEYAGRPVRTFATEPEARRFAREVRWRVVREGQEV